MRKLLSFSLCFALLLALPACAAGKEQPENPYRCTSYLSESFATDGSILSTVRIEYGYSEEDTDLYTTCTHYTDGVETYKETVEKKDAYGNIIKSIHSDNGKTTTYEFTYTLDEQHRPLRIEGFSDGEPYFVTEHSYDKDGNKTFSRYCALENGQITEVTEEECVYDQDGNVIRRSVPVHDSYYQMTYSDGLLVYQASTDEKGNVKTYKEFLYDDQGREIQCSEYNGTGNLKETTKHTYDETGLRKETQTYSAVGKPSSSKVIFTFDIYGNVLSRELHTQNKLGEWSVSNRTTYTYEPIPTP